MLNYQKSRISNQVCLLDMCKGLQQANSVFEAVWFLCDCLANTLALEDCVVYLLNPNKRLKQVAAYGPKCLRPYEIDHALELDLGQGVVGHSALTQAPQLIGETTKSNIYLIDDQSRASELAVPIMYRDTLLGVIDSEHSHRAFYNQQHVEVFQLAAGMAAQTIHLLSSCEFKAADKAPSTKIRIESRPVTCNLADFKQLMKNLHILSAIQTNPWLSCLSERHGLAREELAERIKQFIQARLKYYDGLARYRCYARVLQATYIEAGRKQLQIAADLNLADSTYRRYLRQALELLLSDLNLSFAQQCAESFN